MAGTSRATSSGALLVLAAVIALSACAHQPHVGWTKEGVTQDELRRDQKACLARSNDYSFLNMGGMGANGTGAMTGSSNVTARQQGDIYRTCMLSLGYSLAPAGQKPAAAQPQQ